MVPKAASSEKYQCLVNGQQAGAWISWGLWGSLPPWRPCGRDSILWTSNGRRFAKTPSPSVDLSPDITIVIPVFDEEGILHAAVVDLRERLSPYGLSFEVLLAENGSRDGTIAVARTLAAKFPEVRWLSIAEPNYGAALRRGIALVRAAPSVRNLARTAAVAAVPDRFAAQAAERRRTQVPPEWAAAARSWLDDVRTDLDEVLDPQR